MKNKFLGVRESLFDWRTSGFGDSSNKEQVMLCFKSRNCLCLILKFFKPPELWDESKAVNKMFWLMWHKLVSNSGMKAFISFKTEVNWVCLGESFSQLGSSTHITTGVNEHFKYWVSVTVRQAVFYKTYNVPSTLTPKVVWYCSPVEK